MILFNRSYGDGIPIMIFHGLFGQSDNWTSIARSMADNGLKVVTLDLRNHGLSGHHHRFSYEDMAGDIHETITHLGMRNPVLLGHSMGAKAILWYEYMFPGTSRALIVVDMAMREYPRQHQRVLDGLRAVPVDKIQSRNDAEGILREYIDDPAVRQFLMKNLYRTSNGSGTFQWRFNLPVIAENYDKILQAVPCYASSTPVHLIYGEQSGYILPEDILRYQKQFSFFSFQKIPHAGHWVHAERPGEFLQEVLEFMKKIK